MGIEPWLQLEPVLLSGQGDYDFDGVQCRTEAARCIHATVSLQKLSKGCFRLTCMEMRERINLIVVVACVALLPLLEFVDLVGRAIFPESLSPPTHAGRVIGSSQSLP